MQQHKGGGAAAAVDDEQQDQTQQQMRRPRAHQNQALRLIRQGGQNEQARVMRVEQALTRNPALVRGSGDGRQTPLHVAARLGDYGMVRIILRFLTKERAVEEFLNRGDYKGKTPLMFAAVVSSKPFKRIDHRKVLE